MRLELRDAERARGQADGPGVYSLAAVDVVRRVADYEQLDVGSVALLVMLGGVKASLSDQASGLAQQQQRLEWIEKFSRSKFGVYTDRGEVLHGVLLAYPEEGSAPTAKDVLMAPYFEKSAERR